MCRMWTKHAEPRHVYNYMSAAVCSVVAYPITWSPNVHSFISLEDLDKELLKKTHATASQAVARSRANRDSTGARTAVVVHHEASAVIT